MIIIFVFKIVKLTNLIISEIYTNLFKRIKNKNLIVNFRFIQITQKYLAKGYNKLFKKIKSKAKIEKNYIKSRNDNDFFRSKDITEYLIKNNIQVDNYLKEFDQISRKILERIIERCYYIYTHTLIDGNNLLSLEELEEHRAIIQFKKSLKSRFKSSLRDYSTQVFYYEHGLKIIPSAVKDYLKNKDFIDGGAYNGDSALMFERLYHPKKIYAFEPERGNYNLMVKTIKTNNLKKIVPINQGLGEKNEILKTDNRGKASKITEKGKNEVKITTIDNYVFTNNLNVGLIKLDVEGFGLKALKGAKETIKKFNPILLISIYHNGEEFFETMKYIKKINSRYTYIIRKLEPISLIDDLTLMAWINKDIKT